MTIKKILIFLLIVLAQDFFAQSSSTFSRSGLGDMMYSFSARRVGMGDLGIAVSDEDFIGTLNPASWGRLNRTRIEFGANWNGLTVKQNGLSSFYSELDFSGFAFAFPISKKYGAGGALGIVPFTNVSYKAKQNIQSIENYDITYEGSGGLSKIFLGGSYMLPFNVTLGASLDYYFGNINYNSKANFTQESSYDAEYNRTFRPKGIGGTFGLISPDINGTLKIGGISDVRFGLAVNYISNLETDSSLTSVSTFYTDTIGISIVDMHVPERIMAGISFVAKQTNLFTLDYAFQPWSKFSLNGKTDANLRDAHKFSLGYEYRPQRDNYSGFWQQIMYRVGLSYEQTQYLINNSGINQYTFSLGTSFPIALENTIDIGLQYLIRSGDNSSLLKENTIRVNIGISLGDYWFIRQEK